MQDRGEVATDPVYGKVLAGLHLVSRYAAIPLLDALLTWRKESLKAAARAPELVVLRKRVSTVLCFRMLPAIGHANGTHKTSHEQPNSSTCNHLLKNASVAQMQLQLSLSKP